jgi:hypothetical protein
MIPENSESVINHKAQTKGVPDTSGLGAFSPCFHCKKRGVFMRFTYCFECLQDIAAFVKELVEIRAAVRRKLFRETLGPLPTEGGES